MLKPELFGAQPFRIALAFALAVAVATTGAFTLIYFVVSRDNANRIGMILVQEASLNFEASPERLRSALAARQTPDIRRVDLLALFDAHGEKVLGNFERMPPIAPDGHSHLLSGAVVRRFGGGKEAAILVARKRADGGVTLLGRTMRETRDVENSLLRALAIALLPTIAAILAIGAWFARRALQRLDGVRDAIRKIMEGALDLRLPVSPDGDDIDRVALGVNAMLDEIARLLDQLKNVGDNIAHDMRTPVALARAKLERALEVDDNPTRPQIEAAIAQLDRAAVAISALLRISVIENGPRQKHFRDVDLSNVAAQVAEYFEPLAASKSIAMRISAHDQIWIRGDEDLLREAVSNLVDNAIKFTPPGGLVKLVSRNEASHPRLEVRDTGPGVRSEDRNRIFNRFYRASDGDGPIGHGIGLSIARTIAELHGLELLIEDDGPGACFVMKAGAKASATRLLQ